MNYNSESIETTTSSKRYCMYEDNDFLVEQNEFNVGIIHEVGHNTERDPKRYSTRNDFRDLFGWNHADHHLGTRKDRKLVDEIIACCGEKPFVPDISSEFQQIGMKVIHDILSQDKYYNKLSVFDKGYNPENKQLLAIINKILASYQSETIIKDADIDVLAKQYARSKLFEVACLGVESNIPFCHERPDYPCPEKQIHEGYKNQEWYFYKGSARKQKYSNYAFRTSQ